MPSEAMVCDAMAEMRHVLDSHPGRQWTAIDLQTATRERGGWSSSIVSLAFWRLEEAGVLTIDEEALQVTATAEPPGSPPGSQPRPCETGIERITLQRAGNRFVALAPYGPVLQEALERSGHESQVEAVVVPKSGLVPVFTLTLSRDAVTQLAGEGRRGSVAGLLEARTAAREALGLPSRPPLEEDR